MGFTVDELKKLVANKEAVQLPVNREYRKHRTHMIQVVLKGKALTKEEIADAVGYKGRYLSALNYLEKKGILTTFYVKGSDRMHFCLKEEVTEPKPLKGSGKGK